MVCNGQVLIKGTFEAQKTTPRPQNVPSGEKIGRLPCPSEENVIWSLETPAFKADKGKRMENKKKGVSMPHTFIVIFGVILFAAVLTMFIPLGFLR